MVETGILTVLCSTREHTDQCCRVARAQEAAIVTGNGSELHSTGGRRPAWRETARSDDRGCLPSSLGLLVILVILEEQLLATLLNPVFTCARDGSESRAGHVSKRHFIRVRAWLACTSRLALGSLTPTSCPRSLTHPMLVPIEECADCLDVLSMQLLDLL